MTLVVAPTISPHKCSMTCRKQRKFDHVINKCNNKNACGSKITVRAGDRKQEIYNWWPYSIIEMWLLNYSIIEMWLLSYSIIERWLLSYSIIEMWLLSYSIIEMWLLSYSIIEMWLLSYSIIEMWLLSYSIIEMWLLSYSIIERWLLRDSSTLLKSLIIQISEECSIVSTSFDCLQ